MKKNGFTLAEVLITLTIIGVIATMTLPALMTNTQEQQAKTALKKGINTLTEAAQLSQAIDGIDYASLTSSNTTSGELLTNPSLYALLVNRTQADMQKSGMNRLRKNGQADAENYTMFFRDGTALMFNPAQAMSNVAGANTLEPDGLPHGIRAIFDAIGIKGPNVVCILQQVLIQMQLQHQLLLQNNCKLFVTLQTGLSKTNLQLDLEADLLFLTVLLQDGHLKATNSFSLI